MKRKARPRLSTDGQYAFDRYRQILQQQDDLPAVTICNYLGDLRRFIFWCEDLWDEGQEKRNFTPQTAVTVLVIRYREDLQTSLGLKPSIVNRMLMSLRHYFAWARKTHLIQSNPVSLIKFAPKEASPPRHLDDDQEDALIAAVNVTRTLRDQVIITLLFYICLCAQELCTLIHQQIHLDKRNRALRITGKRKKVREVPLNTTARSILNQYLETLSPESQYLFLSEKTHRVLTGRALGHLETKSATRARVANMSLHDLRHHFSYRMAEVVPLYRACPDHGSWLAGYHHALYSWEKVRPAARCGENRMEDVTNFCWNRQGW